MMDRSNIGERKNGSKGTHGKINGLDITKGNGICTMTFNRPKKLNAITAEMYGGIRDTLIEVAKDDSIKVLVMTGAGKYFSSGNDLTDSARKYADASNSEELRQEANRTFKEFVNAFINFPKLLVCAVNGPAIGISVTVMALADLVYASEDATFHTPFITLGLSLEGCSSYTFPKIMGYARANDVLLAGRKLTAQEAFDRGLVTDVVPQQQFREFMASKVKYLAALPPESVMYSKALNRLREKDKLEQVNEEECVRLAERQMSDECKSAILSFISKQSKM